MNRFRERRHADALEKALERHRRLVDAGRDPVQARAAIAKALDPQVRRLFGLAVGLEEASTPAPTPAFVDAFAERLTTVQLLPVAEPARRQRRRGFRMPAGRAVPGFGFASAAAAIAVVAGLLVPAFRSLPGDPLYSLKRASEAARIGVVSGPREARVRLALASKRFLEVEGLVDRSQAKELSPGHTAAGAPSAQDITDPHLAELIRDTLQDAQQQIQVAADILIAEPKTSNVADDLDDLVQISTRGRKLAEAVIEDLPAPKQSPVIHTVVRLAKIEAEAKAARMQVQPEPTKLQPCDTPAPTPEPTSEATPEAGGTPTPFVSSSPSPTDTPPATPEPTPCISPSPTPTPSPTVAPTPEVTESPTPAPQSAENPDKQRQASESGQDSSAPQPESNGQGA